MARLVNEVKLKFSGAPDQQVSVGAGPITIVVGPNNAGKTTLLREIQAFMQEPGRPRTFQMLHSVSLTHPTRDVWIDRMRDIGAVVGEIEREGTRLPSKFRLPVVGMVELGDQLRSDRFRFVAEPIREIWLRTQVGYIDADNRAGLLPHGPLDLAGRGVHSVIGRLFANDEVRERVRQIVYRAFQKYLVIDPRDTNNAFLRLAGTAPDPSRERSLDEANLNYLDRADLVTAQSHGVRSFVSQVCIMFEPRLSLIIVDEPEISLSQPLAYALGEELAKLSSQNDVQVIAATHSEAFLMGCIGSGQSVEILRLARESGGVAKGMRLSPEALRPLFRRPLLRSAHTMSALFHNSAVVTEGDPDRAFYEEINRRLKACGLPYIQDGVFLRAQNKQTVCEVLAPLRMFGVPAAAIVDIDVFKEGGTNWSRILEAIQVPHPSRPSFESQRAQIAAEITRLEAAGTDPKRSGGTSCFSPPVKATADELIERLAKRGFFVVAQGELESWLKTTGSRGHGPSWLVDMFTRMGDDPDAPDYIKPSAPLSDVWRFIADVAEWCSRADRQGMP